MTRILCVACIVALGGLAGKAASGAGAEAAEAADIKMVRGQTTLLGAVQALARDAKPAFLAILSEALAETPVCLPAEDTSRNAWLGAVSAQSGMDWVEVDGVDILAMPLGSSVSLPVVAGGAEGPSGQFRDDVRVCDGRTHREAVEDLFAALSAAELSAILDGETLQLSGHASAALRRIVSLWSRDPSAASDNAPGPCSVRMVALPWFRARSIQADAYWRTRDSAGMLAGLLGLQPGIGYAGTTTVGDYLSRLSGKIGVSVTCDRRLKSLMLIGSIEGVSPLGIVRALAVGLRCDARQIGQQVHLGLSTSHRESIRREQAPGGKGIPGAILAAALRPLGTRLGAAFGEVCPALQVWLDDGQRQVKLVVFVEDPPVGAGASYSCGLAALFACAELITGGVAKRIQSSLAERWPRETLSMSDLRDAAVHLGIRLQGVEASLDELAADLPCIAHLTSGHFVVVTSIEEHVVHVVDCGFEPKSVPRSAFAVSYSSHALVLR